MGTKGVAVDSGVVEGELGVDAAIGELLACDSGFVGDMVLRECHHQNARSPMRMMFNVMATENPVR